MLSKRIIPCLDIKDGKVVKGVHFKQLRTMGDPAGLAAFYNESGADELVFLDITASQENRGTMAGLAKKVSREIFIPFTVGGGISSVQEMEQVLNNGADKVSLNTAAVRDPGLLSLGRERFGSQAVVLAIDARRTGSGTWNVYTMGGSNNTGLDAVEWARKGQELGAGEILLTSMDRDGTKEGFDTDLINAVCGAVTIPVIASGGGGTPEDFVDVFTGTSCGAALAASIFHSKTYTCGDLKQYLAEQNICVRRQHNEQRCNQFTQV